MHAVLNVSATPWGWGVEGRGSVRGTDWNVLESINCVCHNRRHRPPPTAHRHRPRPSATGHRPPPPPTARPSVQQREKTVRNRAVCEPTYPTEPTEPTYPTEPTHPTETTEPTEPKEPTHPTRSQHVTNT